MSPEEINAALARLAVEFTAPNPADAADPAHEWRATMPRPEHRDGEHYMLGCFARAAAARLGN